MKPPKLKPLFIMPTLIARAVHAALGLGRLPVATIWVWVR